MAKILFGFGGVRFYQWYENEDDKYALFEGATGTLIYKPIQIMKENINRDIVSRLLGYHLEIEISDLFNIEDADWEQYNYLVRILNGMVSSTSQRKVTIFPRLDDTIENDVSFLCILTSDFAPEDLHKLKIGQKINLKFSAVEKQPTIPQQFSDITAGEYWDGTDLYEDENNNTYIDGLG